MLARAKTHVYRVTDSMTKHKHLLLHWWLGFVSRRFRSLSCGRGRRFGSDFPRRWQEVAPAHWARPVRVQPHVNAPHVEKMHAGRQLPHHLTAAHVLQAHRAHHAARGGRRRLTLTPATHLERRALERERRRHIHLRAREARAGGAAGRDDDNQLRARAWPLAPVEVKECN